MPIFDWNDGQLLTLNDGDTATCAGGLAPGQIYGIFLYNSAQNEVGITVDVTFDGSANPIPVTVPGTTDNEGLATLVLFSGSDSNSVSAAVTSPAGASITCFLGSVSMPIDTANIQNLSLPLDGQPQKFQTFTRYFAVPPSSFNQVTIESDVQQFISVQFQENFATINIVNPTENHEKSVLAFGSAKGNFEIQVPAPGTPQQEIVYQLQGDGTQWVWINADSVQNSQNATITMQSLG